ncbi:acyl-CoA dehydrogenase [Kurthia sp. 3B1D]|uniref:Acyl-CoA dehydrogenase n=1 Tax=Candidatus Kurthia intestinigallinarum TaxID=1562256 RepID=A0A433RV23_9BACL|nr:acyl-CoA dehydrogenase family protein [Kurthia sp. 3B1D]RUS57099.1 acyl-CoA dehydrogenase [Kurthia sp. 3B1D]
MSEMKEMLLEVVEKMLKDKVEKEDVDVLEQGQWGEDLWRLLEENGMINIAVPEDQDGAGGDKEDLFAVYQLIGKYAAPIPFVEHTLANVLLNEVGEVAQQTLTTLHIASNVEATLPFVPWARHAEQVVVVTPEKLIVYPLADARVKETTNIASEPRDTVEVTAAPAIEVTLDNATYKQLMKLITAATLIKTSGAIDKAFDLTVRFSKEREQFGRPIHRFQLVQQHLALMAGEQAIMNVAAENILATLEALETNDIGYARLRLEDANRVIAASAHQVHAAIGVTDEHSLNQYTRRIWSWRDELVKADYWKKELVQEVLASTTDIWTALTASKQTQNV